MKLGEFTLHTNNAMQDKLQSGHKQQHSIRSKEEHEQTLKYMEYAGGGKIGGSVLVNMSVTRKTNM